MYDPDKIYEVPLSEIYSDDEFNSRGFIDLLDVTELARDIKDNGLNSPIILQPFDGKPGKKYRIVVGHRRFKAHIVNRSETIRSQIKEGLNEFQARLMNISENVHRKDLNIKQEALALDVFRRAGWAEEVVAQKLHKSRGWVQVRYMLNSLPEDIQNEAAAGLLNQQQIRDLYALIKNEDTDNAYAYIRGIKDAKIRKSSRTPGVEDIVKKSQKKPRQRTEIFYMQEVIRNLFGNNLATRALAWAGGEISDFEMHDSLQREATQQGKFYFVPAEYAKESPEVVAQDAPE